MKATKDIESEKTLEDTISPNQDNKQDFGQVSEALMQTNLLSGAPI